MVPILLKSIEGYYCKMKRKTLEQSIRFAERRMREIINYHGAVYDATCDLGIGKCGDILPLSEWAHWNRVRGYSVSDSVVHKILIADICGRNPIEGQKQ